jgi:hypothetical protein
MSGMLKGRVAFVTGGCGGIGLAVITKSPEGFTPPSYPLKDACLNAGFG